MTKEETIDKMVEEVMEDFDFEKVHDVMKQLDWRWGTPDGILEVPSIYQLMKTSERLLRDVADKYFETEGSHFISTGGFEAALYVDADSKYLKLSFVLEESESEEE